MTYNSVLPSEKEEEEVVDTRPTPSDILATRARIIVLWEKGMSEAAIAQDLGHSRYTVRRWITRWQKDRTLVNKSRETKPRTSTKAEKKARKLAGETSTTDSDTTTTDTTTTTITTDTTTNTTADDTTPATPESTTHDQERFSSSDDSQPATTE